MILYLHINKYFLVMFMTNNMLKATQEELKQGYAFDAEQKRYCCLFCESVYADGIIYNSGDLLVTAEKAASLHIAEAHGSVFKELISENKKYTGLTDTQKELLLKFYSGLSDAEIAKTLGLSPSTVRYQRFAFREKAKQAKIILALSELLETGRQKNMDSILPIHGGATMVDERYMTTTDEQQKVVENFFSSLEPLTLKIFPAKAKNQLVILRTITEQFEGGRRYTEKEVNEVLKPIYSDYVLLRRSLIDYGFMQRTPDCREYWKKP